MYACSEEDTQPAAIPDETKPTIIIVEPTDLTNPLRATVTVKAEATDDTGIAKVEVFVDGISIASTTSSPVEASWDTKTVTDGSHVIKVVAEDIEGNKDEKSLTVEVKNILFRFTIGANYLNEETEGWIFISDKVGITFDLKQMKNSETITFNTPEGFTLDKEYSFTRLESSFYDYGFASNTIFYIATYTSVASNDFIIRNEEASNSSIIGSHTLVINNVPTMDLVYNVISLGAKSGNFIGSWDFGTRPIIADLTKSPADIIYYILGQEEELLEMNNSPLFYRNTAALAGEDEEVDYTSLLSMDYITFDFPDATRSRYSIMYTPTAGEYENLVYVYGQRNSVTPTELKVYIPDIVFPEYLIQTSYESAEGSFSYQKVLTQPSNDFRKLNGAINSFDYSNKKLTIEASGTFKYLTSDANHFESVGDASYYYDWLVVAPNETKSETPLPEIPTELLTLYPKLASIEFNFESATLLERDGIVDYSDWVKLRFSDKSIYTKSKESLSRTQYFLPSGGRVDNNVKNHVPRTDDLGPINPARK